MAAMDAIYKSTSCQELTDAISKDLAGHTTQGAHGFKLCVYIYIYIYILYYSVL